MAEDSIAEASARRRTTLASIAAATLLVVLKLGAGLLTGSLGLISAGIESSGDVVAAILTFFAVRLGGRPADPEHPYGHRRAENLAALGEAGILVVGGLIVSSEAITQLIDGGGALDARWYVFAVIAVALCIDASRVVVSLRTARRYGSAALRSNAFHFAADMAGSFSVLAGLLLVAAGFKQGDAIAALVVAAIIFGAAIRLISENSRVLMDETPEDAREAAERAIAELRPSIELRRLRLRESGGRYFADVVVAVPAGQAVIEGHQAADAVESAIEKALPKSDVVVHVEPRRRGLDLRDRVLASALAEPQVREAHDITIFEHDGQVSVSLHLKLPDDLALRDAHEIAERVEQAIRSEPEVSDVQTHLEPLERPLIAATKANANGIAAAIRQAVKEHAGTEPVDVRLLPTELGTIVFLTIPVGGNPSLTDAHRLASDLEEALRQQVPAIADVVVHTEPQHSARGA
jgi:cation diffusion facilitator family transporter